MIPAAIAAWAGRHAAKIVVVLALIGAIGAAALFREQRDTARMEAAQADARARANADALEQAQATHARQMAAVAADAERARTEAVRLSTDLEAIRRDPSHASAAAPVLRGTIERLRAVRVAGGTAGLSAAAGGAPDMRASTAITGGIAPDAGAGR
ncbi:hypothetical protein KTR66_09905 [Roseococcus sp. SDR]|uniref:hypothetical protein n=1 Tax=Roseococcus sp. SDR TaxID=2835532 RepID=UPI001BD15751|nr:hypothetical protein [Roseococcus sp. SDR]MBS7790311.1 hypothetical protein [Roseococcus sp. SDR]MBV1845625.1 hypothetical protein [Roseococcus sp. SDR]